MGSASLALPCGFHSNALLAMLPSGLLSVWSIQPQALCPVALCPSPELLIAHLSRPSNVHDVPHTLVDKDLQLLLQSLGQPPSFKGTNSIKFKNERPW